MREWIDIASGINSINPLFREVIIISYVLKYKFKIDLIKIYEIMNFHFFIFFDISKNFSPNGLSYLHSKFIQPYELNEYSSSPVDNDLFSFDNFIKSKFLFF